jgi:hypothetical protein
LLTGQEVEDGDDDDDYGMIHCKARSGQKKKKTDVFNL